MKIRLCAAVLAAAVLGLASPVPVVAAPAPEIHLSGKAEFGSDLAAGGYDVVAYQSAAAATAGKKEFSLQWKGATWQFVSAENLAKFKATPEAFAPQYGGYCAYGVSQGAAVHGDPKQWSVIDGKLYLNINADVKATWSKDPAGYNAAADKQWPKVLGH
jgi:YHS domain-containing protein